MYFKKLIFFIVLNILYQVVYSNEKTKENIPSSNTELIKEPNDGLILFSTLNGTFIAIEQHTGHVRWQYDDEPAVKVPNDTSEAITPIILPDPKDGSLYLLGKSDNAETLKKLPFTISQLVASSPCRSSDGILYTGKKTDQWFLFDPRSGQREPVLGWNPLSEAENTCSLSHNSAIYVGKRQYEILMIDGSKSPGTKKRWNITFTDYTATSMTKEMINNYEFLHFTASSSGLVVTLDRRSGNFLWQLDLSSPVVAVYLSTPSGLFSVPFTSMGHNALETLAHIRAHPAPHNHQLKLFPTLYVGKHNYGLYAIPSLVDQNTATISATQSGQLLIEGPVLNSKDMLQQFPSGQNIRWPRTDFPMNELPLFESIIDGQNSVILLGHYSVPESNSRLQITGRNDPVIPSINENGDNKRFMVKGSHLLKSEGISVGIQTDENETNLDSKYVFSNMLRSSFWTLKDWYNQQENKGWIFAMIIVFVLMLSMLLYFNAQIREFQQLSQGSKSSYYGGTGPVTAFSKELDDGRIQVGKIIFHPDKILGKGCEGTFVYKGEFEGRMVAVKRLLPECFSLAEREVSLLRESDAHPHVIRYHCTERDKQFCYIALELCIATLHDYVTSPQDFIQLPNLDRMEILQQSMLGLAYLHSLGIVHRDIKPHNVLLWTNNNNTEIRAMISDFGLCKKLQLGHVSFSRRSGLTGTEGWIAPEMMNENDRTTTSVDIFSMGCVFYFVLSNGKHPFGEPLRRQANILCNSYSLKELCGSHNSCELAGNLISHMLLHDSVKRPPAKAVLMHPLFWTQSKTLTFLQDVSDRIEKADLTDTVVVALERNAEVIVRDNWKQWIDSEVAADLRKYRNYRGDNVRDLLRALRNKKHHYRELTPEAQANLGEIPNVFTDYWTNRFPLLILHTWLSVQCVRTETSFESYYCGSYEFNDSSYKHNYSRMDNTLPEVPEETSAFSEVVDKLNINKWRFSPEKSPNIKRRNRNEIGAEQTNLRYVPRQSSPLKLRSKFTGSENYEGANYNKNRDLNYDWRSAPKHVNEQTTSPQVKSVNKTKKKQYKNTEEPLSWNITPDNV